jgi:hypothetical protein
MHCIKTQYHVKEQYNCIRMECENHKQYKLWKFSDIWWQNADIFSLFLWNIHSSLPLRFVYLRLLYYVASFSEMSIFDCPFVSFIFVFCTLCCQFLWIFHFWLPLRFVYLRLVYPMLSVVLECPFLIVPSFRLSSSGCQFFWSVHFFIAPSVFSNVYLCATEKHMYFVHIVKCWLYVISAHTLIL